MIVRSLASLLLGMCATLATGAETWREPKTGMDFIAIPKGCYQMGLPNDAFKSDDPALHGRVSANEMPEHEVCVDAFWLARFEVRQSDWLRVMGTRHGTSPDNAPVAGITWEQAVEFAARLSALAGMPGRFRLPTEAEWEYACRAGEKALTRSQSKQELDAKAWYSSPYDAEYSGVRVKELQPAGKKRPNAFGLHDMLGNAWEWVQDAYRADAYTQHSLYNPSVTAPAENRVIRGGSLRSAPQMVRCEARAWLPVHSDHLTVGLRLVRTH